MFAAAAGGPGDGSQRPAWRSALELQWLEVTLNTNLGGIGVIINRLFSRPPG